MLRVSLEMFLDTKFTVLLDASNGKPNWSTQYLEVNWAISEKKMKCFPNIFPFQRVLCCVSPCVRHSSSRGARFVHIFHNFPTVHLTDCVCVCLYIVVTHHHHRRSLLFTATLEYFIVPHHASSSSPLPPWHSCIHRQETYVPWDLHVYYSRKQCFLNNSWWCRFITYNNNTTTHKQILTVLLFVVLCLNLRDTSCELSV